MNTAQTEPVVSKLLVVGDQASKRRDFLGWLAAAGYSCVEAQNCAEAWDQLLTQEFALVLLDLRTAGGSDWQLLESIKDRMSDTAVVMLAEASEAERPFAALLRGAYAYLVKPIDREELLFHIDRALEWRQLRIGGRSQALELEQRVSEQTRRVRGDFEETIHRLMATLCQREGETSAHLRRMGLLSEALALAAGWTAVDAEQLRFAAPLHDLGKVTIPDAILSKRGRLDDDEFKIVKQHTVLGSRLLAGSQCAVLRLAEQIALAHHEKWDGNGYPLGSRGNEIPLAARIVAIVDVYDALTHDRAYRPAFSEPHALSIMLDGSGRHFDPELLELFLAELPRMRRIAEEHADGRHELSAEASPPANFAKSPAAE